MDKKIYDSLPALESRIGYTFRNKDLLINALIHSSYMNENQVPCGSNERLEFLGDSVLSLAAAEYLYENVKKDEGYMTKVKAAAVCETALYEYASTFDLGEFLLFGKGDQEEGRKRPSILSDAFEAVLGAMFLDGGYEPVKKFVVPFISELIVEDNGVKDYKTKLQEVVQKNKGEKLYYNIVSETGPAHDRTFVCEVLLNTNKIGRGEGHSKKIAEQKAAEQALSLMGITL